MARTRAARVLAMTLSLIMVMVIMMILVVMVMMIARQKSSLRFVYHTAYARERECSCVCARAHVCVCVLVRLLLFRKANCLHLPSHEHPHNTASKIVSFLLEDTQNTLRCAGMTSDNTTRHARYRYLCRLLLHLQKRYPHPLLPLLSRPRCFLLLPISPLWLRLLIFLHCRWWFWLWR